MPDHTQAERWLPVPGYEGFYEISNRGQVRSIRHMTQAGWRGGKLLSPFLDADGYLRVNLSRYGATRSVTIHTLVLTAFDRPPASGEQGRHGLGGKTDNHLENLEWGTPQENSDDKYRDGTMACGEKQGNSKLTATDIKSIRTRRAAGEEASSLALNFKISETHVNRIVKRESWRHIP